jgi:hypothetical protein
MWYSDGLIGGQMFSGIQEILVLIVIILGILFLPRILNRGREITAAAPKPQVELSGKMRLAIAASIFWPGAMAAFMQPWKNNLYVFLYLGFGPVAFLWIIYWVLSGFRKK